MKSVVTLFFIFHAINLFSQKGEQLQNSNAGSDSISKKEISNVRNKDSLLPQKPDTLSASILNKVQELDEVLINHKSEFNAVSLGILKKEIKPLSVNERKLYTAGDFKLIHLLSILGGSLQIDPIINKISGRTKRLKGYIKLERKEENLIFLEDNFTEYMRRNLNIPEDIVGAFLNYFIENEKLVDLIERKDFGAIHFLMGDEWFQFKSLQKESTSLTEDFSIGEE